MAERYGALYQAIDASGSGFTAPAVSASLPSGAFNPGEDNICELIPLGAGDSGGQFDLRLYAQRPISGVYIPMIEYAGRVTLGTFSGVGHRFAESISGTMSGVPVIVRTPPSGVSAPLSLLIAVAKDTWYSMDFAVVSGASGANAIHS